MVYTTPTLEGMFGKNIIDIEVSDDCDLDCKGCFTAKGKQSEKDMKKQGLVPKLLTVNEIEKIIQQAKKLGFKTVSSSGHGEPTLDQPRFWKFIEIINKYEMTPVIVTNGFWVTSGDAQRLLDNNVSIITKLWSLDEKVNKELIRDPLNRPYVEYEGIKVPEGIANLLKVYTSTIPEKNYKIAINTVINSKNQNEILEILEWGRNQNILPYFEFIFSSGNARQDPNFWLDKKGGKTLYQEPFTERNLRRKIYNAILEKDGELGFTYPVSENPTGKAGQNVFDNTSSLIVNPYGYVVSCPAMADFMRDENGLLSAVDSLDKIVKRGYGKCSSPCAVGEFTCKADKYDREMR